MATAFHLFNLLPLELRQRIWELSLTPRRVPLGEFSRINRPPPPPPAPPPAVLHACAESRSYLVQYYAKIFVGESRYIWVNYDLDTICVVEWAVEKLHDKLRPIKHLSVDCVDQEYFWREDVWDIDYVMTSLEDLEVRPDEKGPCWWYGWDDLLDSIYYDQRPVHFRTVVISPDPDHEVPVLTPENFLKVERDYRRRDMAENPDRYIGREMSDSDDDDNGDVCPQG